MLFVHSSLRAHHRSQPPTTSPSSRVWCCRAPAYASPSANRGPIPATHSPFWSPALPILHHAPHRRPHHRRLHLAGISHLFRHCAQRHRRCLRRHTTRMGSRESRWNLLPRFYAHSRRGTHCCADTWVITLGLLQRLHSLHRNCSQPCSAVLRSLVCEICASFTRDGPGTVIRLH